MGYHAAEAALSILAADLHIASPLLAARLARTDRTLRGAAAVSHRFYGAVGCQQRAFLAVPAPSRPSDAHCRAVWVHAGSQESSNCSAAVTLLEPAEAAQVAEAAQLDADRRIRAACRAGDVAVAHEAYKQLDSDGGFPSDAAVEVLLKGALWRILLHCWSDLPNWRHVAPCGLHSPILQSFREQCCPHVA